MPQQPVKLPDFLRSGADEQLIKVLDNHEQRLADVESTVASGGGGTPVTVVDGGTLS